MNNNCVKINITKYYNTSLPQINPHIFFIPMEFTFLQLINFIKQKINIPESIYIPFFINFNIFIDYNKTIFDIYNNKAIDNILYIQY